MNEEGFKKKCNRCWKEIGYRTVYQHMVTGPDTSTAPVEAPICVNPDCPRDYLLAEEVATSKIEIIYSQPIQYHGGPHGPGKDGNHCDVCKRPTIHMDEIELMSEDVYRA